MCDVRTGIGIRLGGIGIRAPFLHSHLKSCGSVPGLPQVTDNTQHDANSHSSQDAHPMKCDAREGVVGGLHVQSPTYRTDSRGGVCARHTAYASTDGGSSRGVTLGNGAG